MFLVKLFPFIEIYSVVASVFYVVYTSVMFLKKILEIVKIYLKSDMNLKYFMYLVHQYEIHRYALLY